MSEEKDIIGYQSNSHKSREEAMKAPEKKVEKVISGEAKVKKKGFFRKMKDSLISSDDTKSVGSYITTDILIPSIKKAISDIVTTGIDMILYGEARHQSRSSTGSKISYQSYFDRSAASSIRRSTKVTAGYNVEDIIVNSRAEAELALDTLEDTINQYGVASVSDYYDILGITGSYTDNYYGWSNISEARVRAVSGGWLIQLPRPIQLKN